MAIGHPSLQPTVMQLEKTQDHSNPLTEASQTDSTLHEHIHDVQPSSAPLLGTLLRVAPNASLVDTLGTAQMSLCLGLDLSRAVLLSSST